MIHTYLLVYFVFYDFILICVLVWLCVCVCVWGGGGGCIHAYICEQGHLKYHIII